MGRGRHSLGRRQDHRMGRDRHSLGRRRQDHRKDRGRHSLDRPSWNRKGHPQEDRNRHN
jgi:hypothetical protein